MDSTHNTPVFHGTTILSVRRQTPQGMQVAIGGDGQVTLGNIVVKGTARKVRKLYHGKVLAGFAGATADAFTLFERFEAKLEKHQGHLTRAAIELTKDWRTDRVLRRLEAMLAVADASASLIITGNGDVLEPEQVLITSGTQQSLDLISRMLADQNDVAWVENPCYWGAWSSFYANDLNIRAIAVDSEGMNPSAADLSSAPPKFIYITPSHQYPTGAVMSLPRRRQLIDYAQQSGAWLLEDDYDSEFRYSGRPIASLQGLAHESGISRVLYMGTFSKVMFPGIKLSYLVLPKALIPSFQTALYDLYRPGQLHLQASLAEFIEQGHFTTHIRRLRQAYAQRRTILLAVLNKTLNGPVEQMIDDAGLHLVVKLPAHTDDVQIANRCHTQGLSVRPLSRYYIGATEVRGLVVGFAYVDASDLVTCGKMLGQVLNEYL